MPEDFPADIKEKMSDAAKAVTPPAPPATPPAIPPDTPPPPAPGTTQGIDLTGAFGGRFKTVDEIQPLIERADRFKELTEQDLEDIKALRQGDKSLDKVKSDLEALRSQHVISPKFYKLQKIEETQPLIAPLAEKVIGGNASNEELVKLSLIEENPSLAKDPERLDRAFKMKYAEMYTEDADPESQQYQDAQFRMELEAEKVSARITGIIDGIEVPTLESIQAAEAAKQQVIVDGWKSPIEEISAKAKNITISTNGEDPMDLVTMEVSDVDLAKYVEDASRIILGSEMQPTDENKAAITESIRRMYIADHMPAIAAKIVDTILSQTGKQMRDLVFNPTPPAPGKTVVAGSAIPQGKDQANKILADHGMKH